MSSVAAPPLPTDLPAPYVAGGCPQFSPQSRSETTGWVPLRVSAKSSTEDLEVAFRSASKDGILILEDLPRIPPFHEVDSVFRTLQQDPSLIARANTAYNKNLVFKDSFAAGRGGASVDMKRVIDLSPARINTIHSAEPTLTTDIGSDLTSALAFFEETVRTVTPKVLSALGGVIGAPFSDDEVRYNYRLVDYYERPAVTHDASATSGSTEPPRCGAHRDFGPATLIFQDGVGGLEIHRGGEWVPIAPSVECVLLFGLCTSWRSNDRVKSVMHRVTNPPGAGGEVSQRRMSAVLFIGLEESAELKPVVLFEGEKEKYRTASVADVNPKVRRKWQVREGTVSEEQAEEEAREAVEFPTQESLIRHLYKLGPTTDEDGW